MPLVTYSVSVYGSDAGTPRYNRTGVGPWAVNVPMASGWRAPPGSDGWVVVADPVLGRHWSLWRYDPATLSFSGGGWADPSGTVVTAREGWPTGSRFSVSAGLVRLDELRAGRIDHALIFATDIAKPTAFRFPAEGTDGANLRGLPSNRLIVEGSRIQLDPTVDLSTIPAGYQRTIAAALQKYGAYVVDNGSKSVTIYAETAQTYTMSPTGWEYLVNDPTLEAQGISSEWALLQEIPWSRVRVLNSWNGS